MKFQPKITPVTELENRIKGFQDRLSRQGIEGALIIQRADLFYYSGTTQSGWLYIPADGRPLFMVFKDINRAGNESGLDRIIPLLSPKKIPAALEEQGYRLPGVLGLELDVLPAAQFLMFKEIFGGSEIRDISLQVRLQRAVKSEFEINCIRRASALADQVARKAAEVICEGITEIELASELEAHARILGHQGLVSMRLWNNDLFYGHILSGAGAALPGAISSPTSGAGLNPFVGQGAGFVPIQSGEPVLVDYVFALDGYLSDHARIFSLGRLSPDLEQAHSDMLSIQEAVMKKALPGSLTGDLYEYMVQTATDLGHGDTFMGGAEPRIRFAGHGLGIELDEFPFIAQGQSLTLEPGMVIALEPKAVIPGKGVVGIENTFLVKEEGLESLTRFPDRICEIDR
ncbi:M24 family metallopeptidase [Desulfospira joergensenii]|uniref:M24 family metallopeptidase n=1 Tax=Desulfospira joergensenii TaxID=53329 RepID=UPI0003B441F5|nr:Xaa-Pro peptidase family protein [Desulfospira joergensenii]